MSCSQPVNKRARQVTTEMSAQRCVISERLCYTLKKYLQLPKKTLKQTLINFYSNEALQAAKDKLITAVDDLRLDNWTKPAKRRKDSRENVGNKIKLDAEDILDILTFLDENKAIDKLPLFVALDPDLIPSPALAEGDLQCVLGKIANLSDGVKQFIHSQLFTMNSLKSELNDTLNNLLTSHKSKLDGDLLTLSHKMNEINTKFDSLLSCKSASTRSTMAAHTQDKHMTQINQSLSILSILPIIQQWVCQIDRICHTPCHLSLFSRTWLPANRVMTSQWS